MLNILERFVSSQGYSYLRMDGGTSISTRQPLINKFNEVGGDFIITMTPHQNCWNLSIVVTHGKKAKRQSQRY